MFRGVFEGTFPGLPGGEPSPTYLARVAAGFARIERTHADGESVLVVSHGVTLMAYLLMVGGREVHPLPNASISTVEIGSDGSRRVTSVAVDPSGQGVPVLSTPGPSPASAATAAHATAREPATA